MRYLHLVVFVTFTAIIFIPYILAYAFTVVASKIFELLEPKPDYY